MLKKLSIIPLEERIVFDAAMAAVIFVDLTATGQNDGSSWANAYTDLQSALSQAGGTAGAEIIKIAAGTYSPGASVLNSFIIPDETTLIGGFGGKTILSGDVLNNDLLDPNAAGYAASKADNNATVVKVINGSDVVMESLTVTKGYNTSAVLRGGGILVDINSSLQLSKSEISYNFSNLAGGGIAVLNNSTIAIDASLFDHNRATMVGGALIARFGVPSVTISHSVFDSNSAGSNGGALRINELTEFVNIDHTLFINNSSGIQGGGAIAMSTSITGLDSVQELHISYSEFTNNSTTASGLGTGGGGAISAFPESTAASSLLVDITHTDFNNNSSNGPGGALYLANNGNGDINVNIEYSNFNNNTANFGGAIRFASLQGAVLTPGVEIHMAIRHSSFDGNTAVLTTGGQGGALWLGGFDGLGRPIGSVLIESSSFTNNSAGTGGAIFDATVQNLSIANTIFDSNSALVGLSRGGAIAMIDAGSAFTMTKSIMDSHFRNNMAAQGGAIFMQDLGVQQTTLYLDGSYFNQNSATVEGGAFYQRGGTSFVTDNHFQNNTAPLGKDIRVVLPAVINGETTASDIIDALVGQNHQLNDDEIFI